MEEIILKVMVQAMTAERSEKIVTGEKEYKKKSKTIIGCQWASIHCLIYVPYGTIHFYKEGETEQ